MKDIRTLVLRVTDAIKTVMEEEGYEFSHRTRCHFNGTAGLVKSVEFDLSWTGETDNGGDRFRFTTPLPFVEAK